VTTKHENFISMNYILTLLTLIAIFFLATFRQIFDSQRNNEDNGKQHATEVLRSNQAHFYTNPLKSETHDVPAHFKQLPVPNDNSALTILQICIPLTTTSTGIQAYDDHHSSLNDITAPQAFSIMTATTTVTMTQVPAITTAITKAVCCII
jgi:hypothetical protein